MSIRIKNTNSHALMGGDGQSVWIARFTLSQGSQDEQKVLDEQFRISLLTEPFSNADIEVDGVGQILQIKLSGDAKYHYKSIESFVEHMKFLLDDTIMRMYDVTVL